MFGHNERLRRKLKEGGGRWAWATVLESRRQWASSGGANVTAGQAGSFTTHQRLTLRVEPDGEAPFEATVKQVFNDSYGFPIPQEGYAVQVIYDPKDHSKLVNDLEEMPVPPDLDRDEVIARHETMTARMRDSEALRQQIDATRATAVSQGQSVAAIQEMMSTMFAQVQGRAQGTDVADQLTKLADLRDRGVLTEAEFAAQKAKILAAS